MTRRRFWTTAELRLLRKAYPDTPTWRLSERLGRSESAIYGKALALGLRKSRRFLDSPMSGRMRPGSRRGEPHRFKPGHVPHNKGCRGWDSGGRSHKTRFKKGYRPQTWVPVGSTRITKDGILQRKVTDTGYTPRDWRPVHVLLWEAHHGPVPAGHIVVFKNGDRRDIRLDNLEMITRADNMRRNSVHNLPEPLVEVIRLRAVLNRRINKRSNEDEKQDRGSEKPPVRHHRKAAR